jgi:integrase
VRKVAVRSKRISKSVVTDAHPEAARYTIWDTELKGFGLRVTPAGLKTYIARYRVGGGRGGVLRQQVVGRHGKLTPEEARVDAKVILNAAERGFDPQALKVAARDALTLSELCDVYLVEGVANKKPNTLIADTSRIKFHIKPLIGAAKINTMTKADVQRMVREIASGKTATQAAKHVKGGKPSATRTLSLLKSIFAFAVDRKLIVASPAKGVKGYKPNKRERFLSPQEMARLGDALAEMEAEGRHKVALGIIRLLALSGARRNEIARLQWAEVDTGRSTLRLKDSKTGAKVIPLGAAALSMLLSLPKSNSTYVFPDPSDPECPFRGLFYAWSCIRDRANLPGVRIHDLRHSFASAGLASGQALPMIGKLLGHAQVSTTARYAHLADNPVKAAADRISEAVEAAMAGKSADVRDMAGRKVGG